MGSLRVWHGLQVRRTYTSSALASGGSKPRRSGACRAYTPGTCKEGGNQSHLVILLGLLPCNQLGTRPLDYIKKGRVPSRRYTIPPGTTPSVGRDILLQTGCRVAALATRTCINLVSFVLVQTFGFQIMAIPTFYLAAGTSYGGRQV
jgi:hypothetical protein